MGQAVRRSCAVSTVESTQRMDSREGSYSTHRQYASFHIKNSLTESVSISVKLCVPMNVIGGSQTHPQQRNVAHFWWKSLLKLPLRELI
uniref:SFRICE_014513 n=1 Tax=Spodoptera frugiperda TaxID=7108 RepID=A0A2H1WTV3_SPOFR